MYSSSRPAYSSGVRCAARTVCTRRTGCGDLGGGELLALVLEGEAVAGLGLERRRAVPQEGVEAARGQGGELLLRRRPRRAHRAVDAAAGLLDLQVGGAAQAGAVLGRPLARAHGRCVWASTKPGTTAAPSTSTTSASSGTSRARGDLRLAARSRRRGRPAPRRRRAGSRRGRRRRRGRRAQPARRPGPWSRPRSRRARAGRSGRQRSPRSLVRPSASRGSRARSPRTGRRRRPRAAASSSGAR